MGGEAETFLTTHWSLIEDIQSGQDKDRALIGLLLERYWKPVYSYLRRKGYDNEQAKDLTQGFFHEIVLNRNLIKKADQAKGRFRSFLLYALNQYVTKQNLKEKALKRIPKEKLVSLDIIEPPALPESVTKATAEKSYHYAWLSALLENVLSEVKAECDDHGLETHWALFGERVVRPILENRDPPSLSRLCTDYSIEGTKKASNMIMTIKRRFHKALLKAVRSTVLSQEQAVEELNDLLQFFPESAQHFQ